ncbi:MAG: SDR family oxidoreductase [Thermoanaerobaculia bacterium]|nr:SDR family oxidoreductase [Thermoanaerobaculia bacterium]MCZ7651819.1 SDR family oxidoreductase [Thermoanaerobaculia bacterium]
MTDDLEGRTALVTGASAGIGFAAARALALRGARVAISSRGGERLADAQRALADEGIAAAAIAADLRHLEEIERLVEEAQMRLGRIDILVANSGGPTPRPAVELTEEDWRAAVPAVLLFVPRLVRLALPGMREARWGRIVAVNSVSSRQPIPNLALSNALRPAVLGYLKTLSQEVAADGVTVNAVLPGYTLTERQVELAAATAARTGRSSEEVRAGWTAAVPAARLAEPEEIGEAVAFLCSPAAAYVTGQALTVDGGYVRGLL